MSGTCQGDTTLLVGLDEDDLTGASYPAGPQYVIRSGARGFTACANELAVPRAGQYRFIGALGDDNVPETPGWWQRWNRPRSRSGTTCTRCARPVPRSRTCSPARK